MKISDSMILVVPGQPQANERARKGPRGWYTPEPTRLYRELVQKEWMNQGRKYLGAGPLVVRQATFVIQHPPTHMGTGKNARLLKEKYKNTFPPGDNDNYLKGLLDALKELAWVDDKQVMDVLQLSRRWDVAHTSITPHPHTYLHVQRMEWP